MGIQDPPPEDIEEFIPQGPFADDLRVRADDWIRANTEAYRLFERFALEAASAQTSFGIGALTERVRWEARITMRRTDGFKINNNHRAYIARKLLQDHPRLKGLITLRETKW